jgi:RNA polymerase sigma-70 factor (ECF subfamily)
MDCSDAELARRIGAGDRGAEMPLARRFAPRIRLYGLRHLGDEDRAADLVQEVLLIVIEALRAGRVDEPDRVDRFMLGTCRNVIGGWRRGERRRAGLAAELDVAAVAVEPARPPEAARLSRCLHRLGERERAVLLLSYCDERDAEAIGDLLGTSAGNVRVIRHRALRAVRTCLERR